MKSVEELQVEVSALLARIDDLLRANNQYLERARTAERENRKLNARVQHLVYGMAAENDEICQTLGKSLGYPWYKDDQKNFPGATLIDGVCVGEHVSVTLASEAATVIDRLSKQLQQRGS